MSELDKFDFALLEGCAANPCKPLAAYVLPLAGRQEEGKLAERTLYERLEKLEKLGYVEVDRSQKHIALASLSHKGKDAIMGRKDSRPTQEARSS